MIVGNGDIGSILRDRKGAILFAAGLSNSSWVDDLECSREYSLLLHQPKDKCMFYFSTISIALKETPYTVHKLAMELIVKRHWRNYNIIRIGNIDWGKNPHTFLNALRAKKAKGEKFEILDEYRYMISKDQLLLLTDHLPLVGQNEINAFGYMKKVIDLI